MGVTDGDLPFRFFPKIKKGYSLSEENTLFHFVRFRTVRENPSDHIIIIPVLAQQICQRVLVEVLVDHIVQPCPE